jgi:hypothetical protein
MERTPMTEPNADDDLFDALTAINITGPDENGLLWVSFKPDKNDVAVGALSIHAQSAPGRVVLLWRNLQAAALAKAALTRAKD